MPNINWNGSSSAIYEDPGNWDGGFVPTTSDTAVFGSGAAISFLTNSLVVGVDEWLFTGGNYFITIDGTNFSFATGVRVTGGSANIEATNGTIIFAGHSDGGTARYVLDANGALHFQGTGPAGDNNVSLGSLEGDSTGSVQIDNQRLLIGGNNLSTNYAGSIDRFGLGSTGIVVKVGTGTLTLSGNPNVPIEIDGGTVDIASVSAATAHSYQFGPGAQTLRIENAALSFNQCTAYIRSVGPGDAIDLPGLPFVPGASASYFASFGTMSVTSGSSTVFFGTVTVAGGNTQFVVLSDHTGGSRVMPAIVEFRTHKLVDARHHPPGQPSPTNGPDVIVATGANDTVKGLGGDDILVAGAKGVELVGGPGADTFLFQKISASPPKHHDVIWDFKHAQGDKIDLYDLRAAVPGDVPLVFIGGQTFGHYHHHHPTVLGMVRYSHALVEVNVNDNLAPDFAIKIHNGPPLHAGDLVL
jgi:Ca2+-binding RTX toxin-like protein